MYMDKRNLPKINAEVSRLGMGLMRLPQNENGIDYPAAEALVDRLMEGGVTYYDTAFFYHNGESEAFTKRALTSRYPRNSYTIATKMPIGDAEKDGDPQAFVERQMQKIGVDCVDYYLLHGISWVGWEHAERIGANEAVRKMKDAGKIRYHGFSFHGPKEDFPRILDAYDWDFCQIQLNYFDWFLGDAKPLYEAAVERGVGIIVMEPVHGGGLARCHADIQRLFEENGPGRSVASWALRWCGTLPGVDVVLSGMSNQAQVEENLRLFSPLEPLNEREWNVVERAADIFRNLPLIPCTECKYCAKCPKEINIPGFFGGLNDDIRFGWSWYLNEYKQWTPPEKQPPACTACGVCEAACPQGLKIIELLRGIR